MKRKTKFSRILAAFCAVVLLATSVNLGSLAEVFATEDSYTTNLSVVDFTGENCRTFSTSEPLTVSTTESLDGVLIDGMYQIGKGGKIEIGSQNDRYSLWLTVNNSGVLVTQFVAPGWAVHGSKTFTESEIGSFTTTAIRIKIGYEFSNQSADGTTADVQIKIWLGESGYNEINVTGVSTGYLPRRMYVNGTAGAVTLKAVPGQEVYENLSVTDFTGENEMKITEANKKLKASGESLNGVLIDGMYQIAKGGMIQIGTPGSNELRMGVNGHEELVVQYVNSKGGHQAGVFTTSNIGNFLGEAIRIKVGFIFTSLSADGLTATVDMKIWLGDSVTHEITGIEGVTVAQFIRQMYVSGNAGAVILKAVPGQELVVPEYDYKEIGVETITGQKSVKYEGAEATPGTSASINGVKLVGLYNFTGNASVYVGTQQWYGLRLQLDGTNLKYWIAPNASCYDRSITPKQAGVTAFEGNDVRIDVGMHIAETNDDGTVELAYHLRIGDYEKAFIISNVEVSSGTKPFYLIQKLHVVPGTGSLTISQDPYRFAIDDASEYTVIGVEEFTGEDTYTNAAGSAKAFNKSTEGSLDGVIVDGIFNFTGNPIVNIGRTNYGLHIDKNGGKDVLRFLHAEKVNGTNDYKTIAIVTPEMAGCDVTGADVHIQAQFKFLSEDTAKGTVDLQLQLSVGPTYEMTKVLKGVLKENLYRTIYVNPNGGTITLKASDKYDELLTFEDFGITEDTTFSYGDADQKFFGGEGTLDGVVIEGSYFLSGTPTLQFGMTDGIRVQIHMNAGSVLVSQFVDSKGASHGGVKLSIGDGNVPDCDWRYQDLRIKVGVHFSNVTDNTGDVSIKINLGGTYTQEINVEDVANLDQFQKRISVMTRNSGDTLTLKVMQPTGVDVTPGDMGIPNATYGNTVSDAIDISDFTGTGEQEVVKGGSQTFTRSSNSLVGTTIEGIYNLKKGSDIRFGASTNVWSALSLRFNVNNVGALVAHILNGSGTGSSLTLTAADLGFSPVSTDMRIKAEISGEPNADGTTTKLTVNLTFSANGISYKGTITDDAVANTALSSFSQRVWIYNAGAEGAAFLKSTADLPVDAIDVSDFTGSAVKEVPKSSNLAFVRNAKSLVGTTVTGIYNLKKGSDIRFGAAANGWTTLSLRFTVNNAGAIGAHILYNGAAVGTTLTKTATDLGFSPVNTDMQITAKISGVSNGDGTTKLTVNVTFSNGTVSHTDSFTADVDDTLLTGFTQKVWVISSGEGATVIKSPVENQVLSMGEFENFYFDDEAPMTIMGKVFSADVQFDGTKSEIRLGGDSAEGGFSFRRLNGNSFGISNTYNMSEVIIDAQEAGLESANDRFNLKITMNASDNDSDGATDDMLYGIWINDHLYRQQYFKSNNDAANFVGEVVAIYCPSEVGTVRIFTPKKDGLENSAPYILEDFGLTANTYSDSAEKIINNLTVEDVKATTISGKIALTGDASMTMYKITDGDVYTDGFKFYIENGALTVQYIDEFEQLDKTVKFRVPDVTEKEAFTFSVEEELINANDDGCGDVRFGIRINGELYGSKRIYFLDYEDYELYEDYFRENLALTLDAGSGTVQVFDSVKEEAYDLDDTENGYLVSGKGTMSVDNQLVDNGEVVSTMGDHIIRSSGDGSYVKKVILYRGGDVNADGTLDAIDMVEVLRSHKDVIDVSEFTGTEVKEILTNGSEAFVRSANSLVGTTVDGIYNLRKGADIRFGASKDIWNALCLRFTVNNAGALNAHILQNSATVGTTLSKTATDLGFNPVNTDVQIKAKISGVSNGDGTTKLTIKVTFSNGTVSHTDAFTADIADTALTGFTQKVWVRSSAEGATVIKSAPEIDVIDVSEFTGTEVKEILTSGSEAFVRSANSLVETTVDGIYNLRKGADIRFGASKDIWNALCLRFTVNNAGALNAHILQNSATVGTTLSKTATDLGFNPVNTDVQIKAKISGVSNGDGTTKLTIKVTFSNGTVSHTDAFTADIADTALTGFTQKVWVRSSAEGATVIKSAPEIKADTKAERKATDVDNNKVINKSDSLLLLKKVVGRSDAKKVAQLTYEDNVMPIAGFYAPTRGVDEQGNEYDLVTDDIYSKIKDLGVNLVLMSNIDNANSVGNRIVNDSLALADKYELGAYVLDPRYDAACQEEELTAATLAEYQKQFTEHESYKGTFVVDEPFTVAGGRDYVAGKMLAEYKNKLDMLNNYSNTIGYMNIGPMDDLSNKQGYYDHVEESLEPLHKLISWDYYVYDDIAGGQAYASAKGYFANMTYMRQQAQAENKPFWAFIQAGGGWERTDGYNGTTPSEAELLWNVNTSLAYGVKGIQYFPLVQPSGFAYASQLDQFFYDRNGLIGADGTTTPFYSHAQKANKQIIAVDEYLMNATSLDVLAIGSAAKNATGINKTSYGVLESVMAADGAIVGVFDYQGKTAYYVVNYDAYDADTNDVLPQGDAAADEITLNFGSEQNYTVVSTQLATTLTGAYSATCTLSLNNGGAALVILDK